MKRSTLTWFTLIETLVSILIVSIVMVSAFQALSSIWIAKVKLIESTEIEKQAYFAAERFVELIKKGWTLDYEEYWNRSSYDTQYSSGHFLEVSGFWNYWDEWNIWSSIHNDVFYYCASPDGWSMGTWGCLTANNTLWRNDRRPQLYGQYEQQFIDRNSDWDIDNGSWVSVPGDEDGDGNIIWDDDDLFLWEWPEAFSWSLYKNKVGELYLVSNDEQERTYFRWRVETATWSSLPTWAICDYSNPVNPVGEACQWTVEFLKLSWRDYGYDHLSTTIDTDGSQYDGIIDTWMIHKDFTSSNTEIVAGSNSVNYWQSIFPDTIDVSDVEFFAYPNKSLEYSWRDDDTAILIAPYVRLQMTLSPSLKIKKKIVGKTPEVEVITTIQLTNLDIK